MRNCHPQRITTEFPFGKGRVMLTSDFDSGNMARCEQTDLQNHVSYWSSINKMKIVDKIFLFYFIV